MIYCDSDNVVDIVYGGNHYRKTTKTLDTKLNSLRDAIESGRIELKVLDSADNMADTLTKALGRDQFLRQREKMHV